MGLGLSHRRTIIIQSSSSAFATAMARLRGARRRRMRRKLCPSGACICMCHQRQLSRVLQGYCIGHSPPRHRHLQGSDAFVAAAAAAAVAAGSGNRQSTDMQIKFRQNPNALRRSPSSSSAAIAAAGSAILLALPPALAVSCSTNPQLLPPSSPNSLRKRYKHKRTGCAHKMILS